MRETHEHQFDNILLEPQVVPGDTCSVPEGFPGTPSGVIDPTGGMESDPFRQ
jgi:hypothetical protein